LFVFVGIFNSVAVVLFCFCVYGYLFAVFLLRCFVCVACVVCVHVFVVGLLALICVYVCVLCWCAGCVLLDWLLLRLWFRLRFTCCVIRFGGGLLFIWLYILVCFFGGIGWWLFWFLFVLVVFNSVDFIFFIFDFVWLFYCVFVWLLWFDGFWRYFSCFLGVFFRILAVLVWWLFVLYMVLLCLIYDSWRFGCGCCLFCFCLVVLC